MLKYPLQKPVTLDTLDCFLLLILTVISIGSRMWRIDHPDEVVFDEVYFGNFSNYYLKGIYFYDIHPPFGKLVMYVMAMLSEYDGSIQFEGRPSPKHDDSQYIILRLTPAFYGGLCAPLLYFASRFSSFSHTASFMAGFFSICDTSLLTEQRFILSDGMLHFFSCLFLAIFSYSMQKRPYTKEWVLWTVISGISLGACCSCKNTAWGLAVFAVGIHFIQVLQIHKKFDDLLMTDIVWRGLYLAIPSLVVFFGSFAAHFILLPYHGPGVGFMSDANRKHFINPQHNNSQILAKRIMSPSLLSRIISLFIDMHMGNMGLTQFHPSESRPHNWPLLTGRWVDFWNGHGAEIHCLGNVIVYYLAFFSIFPILAAYKKPNWVLGMRYVIGWSLSYFPFYLIPRSMYLYHYLIPLMIGCINVGISLDLWLPSYWRGFVGLILMAASLYGFYLWSPMSYGSLHHDNSYTIWIKNWMYGDEVFRSRSLSRSK